MYNFVEEVNNAISSDDFPNVAQVSGDLGGV